MTRHLLNHSYSKLLLEMWKTPNTQNTKYLMAKYKIQKTANTCWPTLELGTQTTPSHCGQQLSCTSWRKRFSSMGKAEKYASLLPFSHCFCSIIVCTWYEPEAMRSSSQESASFPQTSSSVRFPPLTWMRDSFHTRIWRLRTWGYHPMQLAMMNLTISFSRPMMHVKLWCYWSFLYADHQRLKYTEVHSQEVKTF